MVPSDLLNDGLQPSPVRARHEVPVHSVAALSVRDRDVPSSLDAPTIPLALDTLLAPTPDPVVFLDLDDVLVRNDPYGRFDALAALRGVHARADEVFTCLFDAEAVQALHRVHLALGGRLRYVVSSSWRLQFPRARMVELMRRCGLAFVADGLESIDRWATPHLGHERTRLDEVVRWLDQHHAGEPFVVIDDLHSGASLQKSTGTFRRRVVLCPDFESFGFAQAREAIAALRRPEPTMFFLGSVAVAASARAARGTPEGAGFTGDYCPA